MRRAWRRLKSASCVSPSNLDEFLRLVSSALVPLEARRLYALGIYLFVRAGELKALNWSEVDVERGIVSVRVSWDRESGELKQTKTGNKGIRRFAIEPNLLPLLRAMHTEANGPAPSSRCGTRNGGLPTCANTSKPPA